MKIEYMGLTISIEDDGDGFPIVNIETGGHYLDQNNKPAVDIVLNGDTIHRMFDTV